MYILRNSVEIKKSKLRRQITLDGIGKKIRPGSVGRTELRFFSIVDGISKWPSNRSNYAQITRKVAKQYETYIRQKNEKVKKLRPSTIRTGLRPSLTVDVRNFVFWVIWVILAKISEKFRTSAASVLTAGVIFALDSVILRWWESVVR